MFYLKVKNFSEEQFFFLALLLLLFVNLSQTIYALFVSGFIQFDDIEHLRAAYFVADGDIPYQDFFEHHHPLLWYMLAPIVKILPHNTLLAIYIGRMVSFLVSLISGYYVYKIITKFFSTPLCALVGLNLYFWGIPDISASAMVNIKPDIYMQCCFISGFYYLLCYFKEQKFKYLQICTLLFVLSFLFLQTAVFMIAPLVIPVGYFLYKNPLRYKEFIKASFAPLLIFIFIIGILLYSGIWTTYWQTNWVLNSFIGKILHTYPHREKILLIIDILVIATCALGYYLFYSKFDIYILSVAVLFISELCLRFLVGVTHIYYLKFLLLCSVIISAPFVYKIMRQHILFFCIFILISLFHTGTNIWTVAKLPLYPEEYLKNTSGITVTSGFYQPRLSYYWMYPIFEGLDDMLFKRFNYYDINRLYHQNRPQIIIFSTGWNEDNIKKVTDALKLNYQQQQILKRHIPDIKKIGNYIKIEENVYQRLDNAK